MPRTVTFTDIRQIDTNGDGIAEPTSALSSVTETYDDLNNLVSSVITTDLDGEGVIDFRSVSNFEYDAGNNLVREMTTGVGTAAAYVSTSTRAYDALGRTVAVATDIDLGGDGAPDLRTIERFTYDELGRQVTQTVETDVGADGIIDQRAVFANAYIGQTTVIAGEIDSNGDGLVDTRSTAVNNYDASSRLLSSSFEADNNNDGVIDYRELVSNAYDAAGNLVIEQRLVDRDANGTADFGQAINNTYDAQGQLVSAVVSTDLNGDGIIDEQTSQSVAPASAATASVTDALIV
jgi:hypothetical protein